MIANLGGQKELNNKTRTKHRTPTNNVSNINNESTTTEPQP